MAGRVVAAGGIGPVEIGVDAVGADETANGLPGVGEIGAAGFDAIVATTGIVVAERDEDRLAGQRRREPVGDELCRLDGQPADRRGSGRGAERLGRLVLEAVGQEVAIDDDQIDVGSGAGHGGKARLEQGIVGVLTIGRHGLPGDGRETIRPSADIRFGKRGGQCRRIERIEVNIGHQQERAARIGGGGRHGNQKTGDHTGTQRNGSRHRALPKCAPPANAGTRAPREHFPDTLGNVQPQRRPATIPAGTGRTWHDAC